MTGGTDNVYEDMEEGHTVFEEEHKSNISPLLKTPIAEYDEDEYNKSPPSEAGTEDSDLMDPPSGRSSLRELDEVRSEVLSELAGLINARLSSNQSFSAELEKRLEFASNSKSVSLLQQIKQEEEERQRRRRKQNLLLEDTANIDDLIDRELEEELAALNDLSNELSNTRLFAESITEQEAFNYETLLGKTDKVFEENSPVSSVRSSTNGVETPFDQQAEEKAEEEYEVKRKIGSSHMNSRRKQRDKFQTINGIEAFLEKCDNFSFFNFPVLSIIEKFNNPSLDLSHLTLGDKGAQAISSMLRLNNVIQSLNISDNNITSQGLYDLVNSLKRNSTIKHLDLSDNKLGFVNTSSIDLDEPQPLEQNAYVNPYELKDCGQLLLHLIRKNEHLDTINLNNCHLNDSHLKLLTEGVCDNITLKGLDISSNDFTDSAGPTLASLIIGTRVQMFNLSWTSLRRQGLTHVASSLRQNSSIVDLNLEWIGLSNDHCKMLAQYIAESDIIARFNISHNRISEEGFLAICKAMEINTSLIKFEIGYNTLGNTAMMALFKSLHKNQNNVLKQLDARETQIFVIVNKEALEAEPLIEPVYKIPDKVPEKPGQSKQKPSNNKKDQLNTTIPPPEPAQPEPTGPVETLNQRLGREMFVALRYLKVMHQRGESSLDIKLSNDIEKVLVRGKKTQNE
ncbi:predicted protein [Naegleria gruberi]|uniref:Predicted protein n=1 Tax=Naegleria gruberi TaxID=5762 RepID=D2UX52_NAEGR|nr:uncharacterized protein NAEGRDRAFT_61638 [Naegleria gruberi]EFC50564.1 predicted protein [Naegleria gruberi]|eukprot:XP_002683308.1 predicted protein [Naegleria gruberi strain NEG-M]